MLEYLETLYKTVKTYKSSNNYGSIFKEISDHHYRENYHSDILAMYLRHKEVKKEFIFWLNNCLSDKDNHINDHEYEDGSVEREERRIDILLYSSDKRKAIIIENKSNNADDQPTQLFRYYSDLTKKDIIVEAIFYLNKFSSKEPDLSGLNEEQKEEINDLLIVGQLVEEKSFTENVIEKVIQKTNNIRLNALSQEIRDLFNSVIYGDINMENLKDFVKELSENDNLEKLQKIIEAYHDMPKYFVDKYKRYINSKNTGYKIWVYHDTVLVIDIKIPNGINYAIDICFSCDYVEFDLWIRNTGKENSTKTTLLENLKNNVGDDFPFKNPIDGRGYVLKIQNIFDDIAITNMFDTLLEIGKKYMI
jgi:hypothetical protein